MESTKVIGYRDAFQTLTNRDLAQSLYDESAIIMQDVILTTDGNEHVKRRKTEFHVFRKEISKKYEDLYKINDSEIPSDIQVMINNNEKGTALLRIVEVIGQDELEKIDEDTIYFIINTLNQLNTDLIRNKLLLKVLPLKV